MQSTSVVLMIRPVRFTYNQQTAFSNAFQTEAREEAAEIQEKALAEFDRMVDLLRAEGVEVLVLNDTEEPHKPDSVFPNNWISFHQQQGAVLYPMEALNRRLERRLDLIKWLEQEHNFAPFEVLDLSNYEQQQQYLEGTGSMVLDRLHRIAYACRSSRTHPGVLAHWCRHFNYEPVLFDAADATGIPVYHSNVMMAIGEKIAIVCLEAIVKPEERALVAGKLKETGKKIVEISLKQMLNFAGNMLEVHNRQGQRLMVMSARALESLYPEQVRQIEEHNRIISPDVSTIEQYGGGSVRCMLAEVFLPRK